MVKKLPAFNPAPSVKLALDILKSAEVKNFALIGRIATWFYLDSDLHQFTKDVDFAVPLSVVKAIEQAFQKSRNISALTGRINIAQGNALGSGIKITVSPEGAH
ncbi:MAG: hypothetical protein GY749_23070 [Desulfobacteraceae bacterium]|nr:hypothetical protein [Desulfobacteraceae bacterium]